MQALKKEHFKWLITFKLAVVSWKSLVAWACGQFMTAARIMAKMATWCSLTVFWILAIPIETETWIETFSPDNLQLVLMCIPNKGVTSCSLARIKAEISRLMFALGLSGTSKSSYHGKWWNSIGLPVMYSIHTPLSSLMALTLNSGPLQYRAMSMSSQTMSLW